MAEPVRKFFERLRKIRRFLSIREITRLLTPYTDGIVSRYYIFDELWEKYGSIEEVLPRIPVQIVRMICIRARETFCLRITVGTICIFSIFCLTVMNPVLLMSMGVTFFALLVWDTYVVPNEKLGWEMVTGVLTAVFLFILNGIFGAMFPDWRLPATVVAPHLGASAGAIFVFRYNFAPETGPAHPFKSLLRLHEDQWFVNALWLSLAWAYLLTLDFVAPVKWALQNFGTNFLSMAFFTTAIRAQLNPIGARYRHSMIVITLLTPPFQDEIRMKRDYLLVGADWRKDLTLRSLLEILSFAFGLAPLVIPLWLWYSGDPVADNINWLQMAVNAIAWIVLITTWPYVKKQNRETRTVFDQTIQTFRSLRENSCYISAPSIVLSVEGQI